MDDKKLREEIEVDLIVLQLEKELGLDRSETIDYLAEKRKEMTGLTQYHDSKVGGVISRLGNKYDWSDDMVTALRIATILGTVFMGWPLVVYVVLMFFRDL